MAPATPDKVRPFQGAIPGHFGVNWHPRSSGLTTEPTMFKRALVLPVAILTLMWNPAEQSTIAADVAKPLFESLEPDDICLMPPTLEQRAEYQAAIAAYQSRQGAAAAKGESRGAPPGWPGKNTIGGNIPPTAAVMDPGPTFDGIAVDGENGIVAIGDENPPGPLI